MLKTTIRQILWLFPFISFLLGYYLMNFFFKINNVIVPNLIGKNLTNSAKVLSDHNLNLRILKYKIDSELPENTVIEQFPSNQKMKPNQPVYLVVSKKNSDLKIPELRDKNLQEIKQFLSKNNIKYKIYFIQNVLEQNKCIAQSLAAEKLINIKEKIILYVGSEEQKPIIFPNFIGMNISDVVEFLEKHDLKAKIYETAKNQIIINQRPLPGSIVPLSINLDIQLQTN